MKKVLLPLPSFGFDPTEVAIPWQLLSAKNIHLTFATPDGEIAQADSAMLSGDRLGIWKPLLRARKDAFEACRSMEKCDAFRAPEKYPDLKSERFDALLLPGGHDKRVREYLESSLLHALVVDFFNQKKPVAAICHGVVLAARSIDPGTGKSVLHDYKTTCLLKSQELAAYNLTRLWLQDYYLTYPGLTVEDEVTSALSDSRQFYSGPTPVLRDDLKHLQRGFTLRDRNYLSARWPGDAYSFSLELIKMIAAEDN